MNVIIFSKDRAAQLDLLIGGTPTNLSIRVLWTASNPDFSNAYSMLFVDWSDNWFGDKIIDVEQSLNFKKDVLALVDADEDMTVFFTDDDVIINSLPEIPALPDNVACLSLRLNPHMDYCYTLNRKQTPPKMHPGNVWNWRLADADYGYPMSLDGHIFRTSDILPLLEKLDYHDPNSLEAALAKSPIDRPMMMCFDKSVIVNNPINRVQDTIKNRHGNVSAEWLNEQFLAGKRIKLDPFIGYEPNACHVELPITME